MPAPTKRASMQVGRGLGQERIVLGNTSWVGHNRFRKALSFPMHDTGMTP